MIELPTSVRPTERAGGLTFLEIDAPGGTGELCLQGAHLTSWIPRDHSPVLWMSARSRFAPGLPIRGGIPLCFPWFNFHKDHPDASQHGFARILPWTLMRVREHADAVELALRLQDNPMTRATVWPHRFELTMTITLGTELQLALEVTNRDAREFTFEEAFHTYCAIGDVRRTRVTGLEDLDYIIDGTEFSAEGRPLEPGPTGISRRYPRAISGVIDDAMNRRALSIESESSRGVVVWNPGPETARTMDDFSDDAWPNMLCFETCNVADAAVTLGPGRSHRMGARLSVA